MKKQITLFALIALILFGPFVLAAEGYKIEFQPISAGLPMKIASEPYQTDIVIINYTTETIKAYYNGSPFYVGSSTSARVTSDVRQYPAIRLATARTPEFQFWNRSNVYPFTTLSVYFSGGSYVVYETPITS